MSREVCGICWCPYDEFTGDCACPPDNVQKSTQPDASLLAQELERCRKTCAATSECWRSDADRWSAQRKELLDALKNIDKEFRAHGRQHWPEAVKARAAIAKAEENT